MFVGTQLNVHVDLTREKSLGARRGFFKHDELNAINALAAEP